MHVLFHASPRVNQPTAIAVKYLPRLLGNSAGTGFVQSCFGYLHASFLWQMLCRNAHAFSAKTMPAEMPLTLSSFQDCSARSSFRPFSHLAALAFFFLFVGLLHPAQAAGKYVLPPVSAAPKHPTSPVRVSAHAFTLSPGGTTIQAAVNAAASGDTILLTPGTYSGPGNCDIDFGGKNLTLQGQGSAAQTIIDCGGSSTANHRGFTFHSGETNAVLTNLTIENGQEDSNPGGAISISSGSTAVLNNCILTQNLINSFDGGGAILVSAGGTVTLTGCTLSGNTANGFGAGTGLQNNGTATLLNCTLSDNYAFYLGGTAIGNNGALTLTNCVLTQNTGGYGTGSIDNSGVATISGCTFSQNSGRYTGGIGNSGTLTLVDSLLTGNSAGFAGAIENSGNATITNCTLTQNTAGFGGYGGGLDYAHGTATLTNDILFGDAGVEITPNASGTVNATYCDIQGGYTGASNVNVDPLFVKSPSDLHLTAISPCIGKGTIHAPAFPSADKDGVAFRDPPSLGAYEGPPPARTATKTALTASKSAIFFNQSITFTATVSAPSGVPTGKVAFYEGTTLLGTGNLTQSSGSDQAAYTSTSLAVGNRSITATYAGDTQFSPSTAPAVSVVVTNPVPTLMSLSPTSALIGGAAFDLMLVGTGFNSSTSVQFNSDILTPEATSLTPTQMTVVVPAADLASGGPVSVIAVNAAPEGGTSNALTFQVGNPAPTITSLTPASAPINTTGLTLTINGTDFVAGATASFGTITGLVPDAGSLTSAQMRVSIPDSALKIAGPTSVVVVNPAPGGGASNASTFTVTLPAPLAPILQALAPGDGQISLIFTTVANAATYNLKSSAQSGGPYTTDLTGIASISGSATVTATDPNQTNGILKYYVVSAVGSGGESPNSNELSGTPAHVNQPPVVTLTTPIDGTILTAPANLTLTATASDPDGTVAQVEFFENDISVGVVTAAPYTLPISNLAAGLTTFVAVATDNSGATAASNVATVNVTTPVLGVTILTGPAEQSTICAGTVIFTWSGYSSATPANQLLYQYQVDGGAWSTPSPSAQATLSGLTEGLHTFTVQALNTDSSIAGSPTSRSFYVSLTPPSLLSSIVDARDTRAAINWATSKPTTGQIEYGTTTAYGQNAPADAASESQHITSLIGLTTRTTYHYRIHFTDGCHDVVSDDQTFTTQPLLLPDLEVAAATVPPSFAPLDTVPLTWTVLNAGPGDALINWTDSVYLSTGPTLDATATLVGSFAAASTLYALSSYTQNQSVTIPRVPAGKYYLIIQTNSSNVLPETTTSDNTFAMPVTITALQNLIVTPDQPAFTLKTGVSAVGQFTLTDLSSGNITGITATIQGAPANITVIVTPPSDLQSLQSETVKYTVTATDASVVTSASTVVFTSSSGDTAAAILNTTVIPPTPQLVASPLTLKTSMVRGGQRLVDFTVTNTGGAAAKALTLVLPSTPWLSLTTPSGQGDLAPGATASFELALTPASALPLGLYSGTLNVKGENAGLSIPFAFNCISSATGNLKVVAQDEFSFFAATQPNVAGAHIVISDYTTGVVVVDDVTDSNGILTRTSLPEGDYNVDATAAGHTPYHGTLHLVAGENNEIDPFLSRQLVTYSWNVVPIPLSDQYTIILDATFSTNVPAPVVTVDPVLLDLTKLTYDASGHAVVNYTITNHGLIAANDMTFNFESDALYTLTPTVTTLGTLPPLSAVIVPMTITRNSAPAPSNAKAAHARSSAPHAASAGSSTDPSSLNGAANFMYQCGGPKSGSGTAKALTGEGNPTPTSIITGSGSSNGTGGGGTSSPPSVGTSGDCDSTVLIRTDANRDGNISFDGPDDTTAEKPYTFWINDDSDMMASGELEAVDPAKKGKDYLNDGAPNARDVEDYERLQIKLPDDFDPKGDWELKLQFVPVSGDPQVKLVPAPDSSLSYLTSADANPVQAFSQKLHPITQNEETTIPLTDANLNIDMTKHVLPLLFEGAQEGSGALTVRLYKAGSIVAEDHTDLNILPITKMYDHYTVDPDENGDPTSDSGDSNDVSLEQILPGMPRSVNSDQITHSTNDYILFVHGWRLQRWERIAFAQTAYKRLWHLGYRGRFGLFSWPTEYFPLGEIPVNALLNLHNYNDSERKAFLSASALNSVLETLNNRYQLHVFAHSMGNDVVSEALHIDVTSGSPHKLVQTYVASQSAVPAESYNTNAAEVRNEVVPNLPDVFKFYYTGFVPDQPYFRSIDQAANTIINFFNSLDVAVGSSGAWAKNQTFKPSGGYSFKVHNDIHGNDYWDLPTGFYQEFRRLTFPDDRYEIFAEAAPALSNSAGGQSGLGQPFSPDLQVDLTSYGFGDGPNDHSAQFESSFDQSKQVQYWKALLNAFELGKGTLN